MKKICIFFSAIVRYFSLSYGLTVDNIYADSIVWKILFWFAFDFVRLHSIEFRTKLISGVIVSR